MNKNTQKFFDLGKLHYGKGDFDEALKFFKQAYQLDSINPKIANNLGVVLKIKGNLRGAKYYLKKAIKVNSKSAQAYGNLANVYILENKLFEAEKYYQKAIKLDPKYSDAINNLANLKRTVGKTEEALLLYQKALKLSPKSVGIKNNIAVLQYESGQLKKAKENLKKIDTSGKDNSDILYNLGLVHLQLKEYGQAYDVFSQVNRVNPGSETVLNSLIITAKHLCEWGNVKTLSKNLNRLTLKSIKHEKLLGETPYLANTNSDDSKRKLKVAKAWANHYKQKVKSYKKFKTRSINFREKSRKKIRIGYLSNNYNNHAVAHVVKDLFKSHDKKQFRIYGYSYGSPDNTKWYHDTKNSFNVFRDVRSLDFYQTAKIIHQDKIDILVDMVGYMNEARPEIAALRPAPIMVNFLGLTGTTGGLADYIIADKNLIPLEQKKYYSEKIINLPDCYQPNAPRDLDFIQIGNSGVGVSKKVIVFSCFNRSYKIEKEIFEIWMKILNRVPKSVLWLWEESELASKNLKKAAKENGVNPKRIIFFGTQNFEDHLQRQSLADIALDTFPYSGGATTSNALWTGVPVITLAGKSYTSRMSASLVSAVGMSELATKTPLKYENLVVSLATNKNKLKLVIDKLKMGIEEKPLFNINLYTQNLESAYKDLVKNSFSV